MPRTIKRHVIREFEEHERPPFTTPPMPKAKKSPSTMMEFLTLLGLGDHADCKWVQEGRCVYCADHNVRLYNGPLPPEKK